MKGHDCQYLLKIIKRSLNSYSNTVSPGLVRGLDYLKDPRLNKGLAFTLEERQALGIHGLLAPRIKTQDEQVQICLENLQSYQNPLNKYIYLMALHDRHEHLFFRLLSENIEFLLPIVYTPTVGLAAQKFGLLYRRPHGLFITIHDRGHVSEILKNWPSPSVQSVVMTDGERILGLGDLGAFGMAIPIGKLSLYTALGGLKPYKTLPICVDVGTNTQSLIDDPHYVGLKIPRTTGKLYDELLDEIMGCIVDKYGQDTLIQMEDFANHNAHRLLEKYRNHYCVFNDDIQGTAAVILAGLFASVRITKIPLNQQTFLFVGAGSAASGIAHLVHYAIMKESLLTPDEAAEKIFMTDISGLLVNGRVDLTKSNKRFSKVMPFEKNLLEIVRNIKPTAIIGTSTTKGIFTPEILQEMARLNKCPVIFALSNPTSKMECTAEEAYMHTEGRAVFAGGSPNPPFVLNDQTFHPGQGNNAYIFPGVALGVIRAGLHHISDNVFYLAARTLAAHVGELDLNVGRVYPPLQDIPRISMDIAQAIMEDAYRNGTATTYPEPLDKRTYLNRKAYCYFYSDILPERYDWPNTNGSPESPE